MLFRSTRLWCRDPLLQASQQCECTWKLDDEVSRFRGQPALEQTRSVWLGKGPRGQGASCGAALPGAAACRVPLGPAGADGCSSRRFAGIWRVMSRPPACLADPLVHSPPQHTHRVHRVPPGLTCLDCEAQARPARRNGTSSWKSGPTRRHPAHTECCALLDSSRVPQGTHERAAPRFARITLSVRSLSIESVSSRKS